MGVQHSSADQFTPNMEAAPTMSSLPNPHCGDRAIELQQFTARPMSTPQLSSSLQFDIYNL